jgi:predicted RNase H-like HicB family nuclease
MEFEYCYFQFWQDAKRALKCLKEALELHFEDASSQEIGKVERPDLVPFDLKYA